MTPSSSKHMKLTLGKVCPHCHYVVPYHEHYCYHCGLNFKLHARCAAIDAGKNSFPSMKMIQTCPHCHHQISQTDRYCHFCGYDLFHQH